MNLTELKEQIFESGSINQDWENDELGTVHQIQVQAEFLVSKALTNAEITYFKSKQLLTDLLAEYGYDYPITTTTNIYRDTEDDFCYTCGYNVAVQNGLCVSCLD